MSDELEDIDAMLQAHFGKGSASRIENRRQREARAMSHTTRRASNHVETKTVQLNMRVTPSFKKTLGALAAARGVSIVELIEMAIGGMGQ